MCFPLPTNPSPNRLQGHQGRRRPCCKNTSPAVHPRDVQPDRVLGRWGGVPLFLSRRATFWVALIWCQLSPIVAVQQGVDRRQRHRAFQCLLKVMFDLTDHHNATIASLLQKRPGYSRLATHHASPRMGRVDAAPGLHACDGVDSLILQNFFKCYIFNSAQPLFLLPLKPFSSFL